MIKLRDPNEPQGLSRLINHRIDGALETERAGELPRDYLGASVLGDPCDRSLGYHYIGEREAVSGRTLRILEAGHTFEALLGRWVRLAGFDLEDIDPSTGGQYEFLVAGGRIRGHADGIIRKGPDLGIAYPLLWEAKALNNSSWTELTRLRLQAAKPVYFAQMQVLMLRLPTGKALVFAAGRLAIDEQPEPILATEFAGVGGVL
jgi:hypothetical protein